MKKSITIIFVFSFFIFNFSFCTIINVPDEQPTIQSGIDASVDGDTVLVQPGTYFENINFNGHNITLGSLFIMTGDTSYITQTIIDGNENSSVIAFESEENLLAIFCGFTITNGSGFEVDLYVDGHFIMVGGGLYIYNSTPTINYVHVLDNHAERGGGIYLNSANPEFSNMKITNNYSSLGGGITCINSSPVIYQSMIANNGVLNGNCCDSYGGGMYLENSNPILNGVVFHHNNAGLMAGWIVGYGGAISCFGSEPVLENVTITENAASDGGSGIFCDNSFPVISNSIIWGNQDSNISIMSGFPIITYSDIQDSIGYLGNIHVDPLFIDPENYDYHLQPDSPCIDAGDPDSPLDPDGTIADMGAYYFDQSGECLMLGDVTEDGEINVIDITVTVGCILDDIGDCLCADINADGSVDVSDIVLMVEIILGD